MKWSRYNNLFQSQRSRACFTKILSIISRGAAGVKKGEES